MKLFNVCRFGGLWYMYRRITHLFDGFENSRLCRGLTVSLNSAPCQRIPGETGLRGFPGGLDGSYSSTLACVPRASGSISRMKIDLEPQGEPSRARPWFYFALHAQSPPQAGLGSRKMIAIPADTRGVIAMGDTAHISAAPAGYECAKERCALDSNIALLPCLPQT